jgi:hypothetical protein
MAPKRFHCIDCGDLLLLREREDGVVATTPDLVVDDVGAVNDGENEVADSTGVDLINQLRP